jgi:predicted porin
VFKKLIPSLVLCLPIVGAQAQAQSSVTVYGVVDLSVGLQHAGSGVNRKVLDSGVANGSRLGFRGTEDLGGGISANFALEMGIGVDTGVMQQGGLAWGRQAWVGVSTSTWSLSAGRQYSPLWQSLFYADASGQSYWGNSNLTGINIPSASAAGDGVQGAMARINNSVLATATGNGFIGRLMIAGGDESANGGGRLVNPGITYSNGPFGITASYLAQKQSVKDIPANAGPTWNRAVTAGAQYDFGVAKAFVGYFMYDPSETNLTQTTNTPLKTTSFNIGTQVPIGNGRIIAQVYSTRFDRVAGTPDGQATTLALTYDYALSKRTTLYTSYAHVTNNATASLGLFSATANFAASGLGQDPSILAFGMRHSF